MKAAGSMVTGLPSRSVRDCSAAVPFLMKSPSGPSEAWNARAVAAALASRVNAVVS